MSAKPDYTPRPVVLRFAEDMELKLKANDYKGSWPEDRLWLLERLKEEVRELDQELWAQATQNTPMRRVIAECADVANFAMMIAEVTRRTT